jgi:hypothetical protein
MPKAAVATAAACRDFQQSELVRNGVRKLIEA